MNIINVNSRYGLDPAIVQYAHAVAESYDRYADKGPYCRDSLTDLMNRIPVLLFSEASMPEIPLMDKSVLTADEDPNEKQDPCNIDLLGYYQSAHPITPSHTIPIVGLCPERILQYCTRDDGSLHVELFTIITTKVIIHEYAHAMMALPYASAGVTYGNFYLWMEESMANAFTLKCFEAHARSGSHHQCYTPTQGHRVIHSTPSFRLNPLAVVTEFMLQQPAHYALGVFMHEHGLGHHWLWSVNKSSCNNRINEKRAYLRAVSAQPTDLETVQATLYNVFGMTREQLHTELVLYSYEQQLHRAVSIRDRHCCTLLLDAGVVNVDCGDINGWTPLHHAVFAGDTDMAKLLIDKGADVNAPAADGSTPLHIAVLGSAVL